MSKFPIKFEVFAKATPGISIPWQSSSPNLEPITIGVPADFGGPGKTYTPEDLYGLAVINCLIAVYKALCEKNNVTFENIEGKIIVTMDKNQENDELILSHLDISFNITKPSDERKARSLLEKALKACPVTNSLKPGKVCHINIK
jgi:uncharacterized OsmC-like protein